MNDSRPATSVRGRLTGASRAAVTGGVSSFPSRVRIGWLCVGLAIITFFGAPLSRAMAQAVPSEVSLDNFSALRFFPGTAGDDYLATESARTTGHLELSGGLYFDYGHAPFTLYNAECDANGENCVLGDEEVRLVKYVAAAHLTAALALADRISVGVDLPLVYTAGESFEYTPSGAGSFVALKGGQSFALADPLLRVKVGLFRGETGFALGMSAHATIPTGQAIAEDRFVGHGGVSGGAAVLAEYARGPLGFALNLGGLYRPKAELFSTRVASALTYKAALRYAITPLVSALAEIDGETAFSNRVDENPAEVRAGLSFTLGDLQLVAAGGTGLFAGVGTPAFRVIAALRWAPSQQDLDGDGVLDAQDACPSEMEDRDGYFDEDGCPEYDNDSDGRPDAEDPCPSEAEDVDGFEDEDGCPDTDNDGDGIADGYDSCPMVAEDKDGDRDNDGCPEADQDHDGIEDDRDRCPTEPEDTDGYGDEDGCPEDDFDLDGFPDDNDVCPDAPETINNVEDDDGCPEPDSDGDGVVDVSDRCPGELETINGREDGDGCPDGEALVTVQGDRLLLSSPLVLGRGRRLPREAKGQLAAIAFALRAYPRFARTRVVVRGPDAAQASKDAERLLTYLEETGVHRARLEVQTHLRGEVDVQFVGLSPEPVAEAPEPDAP